MGPHGGRPSRPRREALRREERGVMAIFLALMICFVMIPLGALVVDIGMQRVARQDAQAVADTAAMDTARVLAANPSVARTALTSAAEASVARDSGAVGSGITVLAFPGYVSQTAAFESDQSLGCGSPQGANPGNGYFSTTSGKTPNAVLVTASSTVDYSIHGGHGGVCRSAIAMAEQTACYRADSFALGLATNDSVLRGLLGHDAAVRVLSNKGIANASVSLLGLAAKLGVGTPQDLVDLQNLSVGQFLDAAAAVLEDSGDTASVALASQLIGLKGDLGSITGLTVPLSQLVDLGQGNSSALDAAVNVFDVVTGTAEIANGTNAINVPDLALNLGLVDATANLYVTAPGKQACNGGVSTSTQGHIEIKGKVGLCNSLLAVCATVKLTVNLANASAKQAPDWVCSPDDLTLDVFDQTLANIRLQADVSAKLLFLPVPVATVDTGAPGAGPTKDYDLPLPTSYTTPVETSSGGIGLDLEGANVTLLGGISLGPVLGLLDPVVSAVTNTLVPNLADALGLTVDGADLSAIPEVSCDSPRLVG